MEIKCADTLLRLQGSTNGVIPDPKTGRPGIIPVSRSTWWEWVASGRAPQPVKIGRCTFWRESDIRAFVASAQAEANR
jgi:hypothetical protein